MAPGTHLRLRLGQRTTLTPELRQSLTMLCLPSLDLEELLRAEAERNPLLVVDFPEVTVNGTAGRESAYDRATRTAAATESLTGSVRRQLGLQALAPNILEVAEYLAGDLDERGFLSTKLAETAATLGCTRAVAEAALAAIQRCEPVGIGARSGAEALALQLGDHGLDPATSRAVVARVPLFIDGATRQICDELDLPEDEVDRIAAILPTLTLNPAEPRREVTYRRPDLSVIRTHDGRLEVAVAGSPTVQLDQDLAARLPLHGPTSPLSLLHDRARAILRATTFRNETLARVGAHIVARQTAFFRQGDSAMGPMTRASVARDLDLHPSTVGRAIRDKCLEFEGRLIPLEAFFSQALPTGPDGTQSAFAIKHLIVELIRTETPAAPLSDAALAAALQDAGVDIARRTVAKYRQWLKMPSSVGRRRRAAAKAGQHPARRPVHPEASSH